MASFMTSNVNNFTSDAKTDTITDFQTNAASRAKQNTVQAELSSKAPPHLPEAASDEIAL